MLMPCCLLGGYRFGGTYRTLVQDILAFNNVYILTKSHVFTLEVKIIWRRYRTHITPAWCKWISEYACNADGFKVWIRVPNYLLKQSILFPTADMCIPWWNIHHVYSTFWSRNSPAIRNGNEKKWRICKSKLETGENCIRLYEYSADREVVVWCRPALFAYNNEVSPLLIILRLIVLSVSFYGSECPPSSVSSHDIKVPKKLVVRTTGKPKAVNINSNKY
jgi:hypothetical protein